MMQRHYLDSVADNQDLDPQFKSLLRHHWMEEAQHARLDTLMVESLAEGRTAMRSEQAIEEYLEIGGFIDGGMQQQTRARPRSLERATRSQPDAGRARAGQRGPAQGAPLDVPRLGDHASEFPGHGGELGPGLREKLEAVGPAFS